MRVPVPRTTEVWCPIFPYTEGSSQIQISMVFSLMEKLPKLHFVKRRFIKFVSARSLTSRASYSTFVLDFASSAYLVNRTWHPDGGYGEREWVTEWCMWIPGLYRNIKKYTFSRFLACCIRESGSFVLLLLSIVIRQKSITFLTIQLYTVKSVSLCFVCENSVPGQYIMMKCIWKILTSTLFNNIDI